MPVPVRLGGGGGYFVQTAGHSLLLRRRDEVRRLQQRSGVNTPWIWVFEVHDPDDRCAQDQQRWQTGTEQGPPPGAVSLLILGHPRRNRWIPGDTTTEVIRRLSGVDVHVLRAEPAAG